MARAMRLPLALVFALLAFFAPTAPAAECGERLDYVRIHDLSRDLGRSLAGLSVYDGTLRVGGLELVSYVVHDATVVAERVGRVALLAELRDAMRHEGERSFVRFKMSHEASLLKHASAGALRSLTELRARLALNDRAGELAALHAALARAEQLFGICDSPL